MAMLTEKQNFMKVINGETPEWVPRYYMGKDPHATYPQQCGSMSPSFYMKDRTPQGGFDIWGVEFITTEETGWQALPKPNQFILDDIRKWRDVIKVPDISGIDWEAMAKKDIATMGANPDDVAVIIGTHVGYFQHLMNFMGFNNGLVAMYEEPEEVLALFEYLSDFFVEMATKTLEYYPADILTITDDTATATNPFISPQMYRDMVKPYAARLGKLAMDRGLPVMMHNCGRCEDSIDDWRDFGVKAWNPAQIVNDLDGIKQKYGNELVLVGCWDSQGPAGWPDAPEELVRQAVRDTIDRYATGGGFMFWGSVYGAIGDPAVDNKRKWMTDEYEKYRYTPYK